MNKREKKYSDDQLKSILEELVKKIPLKEINPFRLEKETGIGRHTWNRRMKGTLESLKQQTQINLNTEEGTSVVLPNVFEIVDNYWNDKSQMIAAFKVYDDVIQQLYQDSIELKTVQAELENRKGENKKLKEELKLEKSNVKYYEEQYMQVAIKSKSPSKRTSEGLADVLDIRKNKKKSSSNDFVKNFPELFDE